MHDFGALLKELRVAKGLSQAQLGQKIHKSKTIISNYENNLKTPPLDTLCDLALLYNVSLDYLAGIERKQSIIVDGLTDNQKSTVQKVVAEFRNKPIVKRPGLTAKQQEIINDLIVEFSLK